MTLRKIQRRDTKVSQAYYCKYMYPANQNCHDSSNSHPTEKESHTGDSYNTPSACPKSEQAASRFLSVSYTKVCEPWACARYVADELRSGTVSCGHLLLEINFNEVQGRQRANKGKIEASFVRWRLGISMNTADTI